jgi:hypothetical protein
MQNVTTTKRGFPMTNILQQIVFLPELFSKPVFVSFLRDHLRSNGGSILLKAIDKKLGTSWLIADSFNNPRLADQPD